MLTIHADVPLTRRKTLHHVVDPSGTLLYSSKNFLACVAYAYAQGHYRVLIVGEAEEGEATFYVTLRLRERSPELITTGTTP